MEILSKTRKNTSQSDLIRLHSFHKLILMINRKILDLKRRRLIQLTCFKVFYLVVVAQVYLILKIYLESM